MSLHQKSVYTLAIWLCAFLATAGCGGSPNDSQAPAADVASDPEIPTVTLPDESSAAAETSPANDSSANN